MNIGQAENIYLKYKRLTDARWLLALYENNSVNYTRTSIFKEKYNKLKKEIETLQNEIIEI